MVHGSMEIVHEGWLTKSPPPKRLVKMRWRKRWFVLRSGDLPGQYLLEYYVDNTRKKLKGTIDLDQCEQVDSAVMFPSQKELGENSFTFDIRTPHRVYYLQCQTELEMNEWVECLCQVCGLQPDDSMTAGTLVPQCAPSRSIPVLLNATTLPSAKDPQSDVLKPNTVSSISGPYIPISECITGKKITSNNNRNNDSNVPAVSNHVNHSNSNLSTWQAFSTTPNSVRRLSIPSEMAPPVPLGPSSLNPSNTSIATCASTATASTLAADTSLGHSAFPVFARTAHNPGAACHSGGAKPREFYDHTRPLRGPSCGDQPLTPSFPHLPRSSAAPEDSTVKSPFGTDSNSSVFLDDDWSSTTPHSITSQGFFDHLSPATEGEAPPRPPKPPHLEAPQQNYMNLESVAHTSCSRKNSAAESLLSARLLSTPASGSGQDSTKSSDAEPSPLSASSNMSGRHEHAVSMYDFPRTHVLENASNRRSNIKRQCYNNATSVNLHTESGVMNEINTQTAAETEFRENSALYCNLNALHLSETNRSGPPAVNRDLKPKRLPSDGSSACSMEMSPSYSSNDTNIAFISGPVVDRNLKPSCKATTDSASASTDFVLDPVPRRRPSRGGSSRPVPSSMTSTSPSFSLPRGAEDSTDLSLTASSYRLSNVHDEQIFFPHNCVRSPHPDEIQYLDLDLNSGSTLPGKSSNNLKKQGHNVEHAELFDSGDSACGAAAAAVHKPESSKVEYQVVDFVKTEALHKVRIEIENNYKNNQS